MSRWWYTFAQVAKSADLVVSSSQKVSGKLQFDTLMLHCLLYWPLAVVRWLLFLDELSKNVESKWVTIRTQVIWWCFFKKKLAKHSSPKLKRKVKDRINTVALHPLQSSWLALKVNQLIVVVILIASIYFKLSSYFYVDCK